MQAALDRRYAHEPHHEDTRKTVTTRDLTVHPGLVGLGFGYDEP